MAGLIFTEGAGVADSIFGYSQAPIRAFLEKRAEAYEQESMLDKLFNMGKTTNGVDRYTSMTDFEDFIPVGENGAYPGTTNKEGYDKYIKQQTWKNSFSVTKEAVEDSKLIDFRQKPQKFIATYYRAREKHGAAMYGAAMNGKTTFKSGGFVFDTACADAKPLFHAEHPAAGRGSKQSNVASDTFSADALAYAEAHMQNTRNDDGQLLAIVPDTIMIANDAELKKTVFEVIGADKDPATANNAMNFLFGRWNVIIWSYLNDYVPAGAKPWFLMSSQYLSDYDAAPWLDRVNLEVKSDIDPNTDANIWRGRARFGAGFVDWRYIFAGGMKGADAIVKKTA